MMSLIWENIRIKDIIVKWIIIELLLGGCRISLGLFARTFFFLLLLCCLFISCSTHEEPTQNIVKMFGTYKPKNFWKEYTVPLAKDWQCMLVVRLTIFAQPLGTCLNMERQLVAFKWNMVALCNDNEVSQQIQFDGLTTVWIYCTFFCCSVLTMNLY